MAKFRKKPVVIEAIQYEVENCKEVHDFLGMEHPEDYGNCDIGIIIETLEGSMKAETGDWIIKGIKNEFYPCKPDIFEATYEAVE